MSYSDQKLEQLVDNYAVRGRQVALERRRARLRIGGYTGIAVVATALAGAGLSTLDWPLTSATAQHDSQSGDSKSSDSGITRQMAEAPAVEIPAVAPRLQQSIAQRDAMHAEIAGLETLRSDLQRQRQLLSEQQEALSSDVAAVDAQRAHLALQQERLQADQNKLHATRSDLAATEAHISTESPRLQAAIDELRQQRQQLDDERKRFKAQRKLLEHEIALLNEQRVALQAEQERLQLEFESLQQLMEQAASLRLQIEQRDAEVQLAENPVENSDEQLYVPSTEQLLAASETRIADGELGEIRGGFEIGGNLDISIGLTRSVGINGVEQYSSAFTLTGAQAVTYDQLAAMTPVVIQNGGNNTADTSAMGAWTAGLPVIIQNTLDNQHIINANVLDVTISNVASRAASISAETAVHDSLTLQQ